MSVLRALNLAKSYKSRQVLRDLSLEVESGEVVGLLGPNGAGKTTAFYMVVGLAKCEHGEIFLDNRNITRMAMHRRAQLGVRLRQRRAAIQRRLRQGTDPCLAQGVKAGCRSIHRPSLR